MRPARWADFEPDDDNGPDPLPAGDLNPPRRRPPTAVGTATPKPPPRPYRPTRYASGLTRLQRIARTALGTLLIGTGSTVALTTSSSWVVIAAALGLVAPGALVTVRAARARSAYRDVP